MADEDLSFLLRAFGGKEGCPPVETFASYLEGRLPRRERKALERHLSECPLCRREAEAARASWDQKERTFPKVPAVAAAALLLALGGFLLFRFTRSSPPLAQAERLLAGNDVAGAARVLEAWLKGPLSPGPSGQARCLSLLLGKPPSPAGKPASRAPAPVFRGKASPPPRVIYPLGEILERRPSFYLEGGKKGAYLWIWPLAGKGREEGKSIRLFCPKGRKVLPFPAALPSLEPGEYAIQVRTPGGLARVSWFRVLGGSRVEGLEKEWREVSRGVTDPFLLKALRIRFFLSRGLKGEAYLRLKSLDSSPAGGSPPVRDWIRHLEKILCSGS